MIAFEGVGTGEGSVLGGRQGVGHSRQGPASWGKGLMRVSVSGYQLRGEPGNKVGKRS